ncbi:MAG: hypothetical protein U1E60_18920 [Reyranellaceae bacterium]
MVLLSIFCHSCRPVAGTRQRLDKNFEVFVVQTSQAVAHFRAGAAIETFRKWRR